MSIATSVFTALQKYESAAGEIALARKAAGGVAGFARLAGEPVWIHQAQGALTHPEHLDRCALAYVSAEMIDLVRVAGASLPLFDFDPRSLPWPRAFVVLEKPVRVWEDVDLSVVTWGEVGALLLKPGKRHPYVVAGCVERDGRIASVGVSKLAPGEPWPRDHADEDWVRFVCALWLLIQQRVSVQTTARISRPDQKRWDRRHDRPVPEVTVIELRRPIQSTPHDDSHVEHVDWSHRWIVDGHWRNQYHPSTDSHVPTWIAPYVKGPEDKPLVVKRKINAWVR